MWEKRPKRSCRRPKANDNDDAYLTFITSNLGSVISSMA
jgi:hypothetical protein